MSDLDPQDEALIQREMANALHALYYQVIRQPLPDQITALLEQLEATQARRGEGDYRRPVARMLRASSPRHSASSRIDEKAARP